MGWISWRINGDNFKQVVQRSKSRKDPTSHGTSRVILHCPDDQMILVAFDRVETRYKLTLFVIYQVHWMPLVLPKLIECFHQDSCGYRKSKLEQTQKDGPGQRKNTVTNRYCRLRSSWYVPLGMDVIGLPPMSLKQKQNINWRIRVKKPWNWAQGQNVAEACPCFLRDWLNLVGIQCSIKLSRFD